MTEENTNPEELTQAELLQELADETQDIVEAVLEDGSNPDAVYMIEHHISCTDFDQLEKAAVACFKKGYEVTDPEELDRQCHQIHPAWRSEHLCPLVGRAKPDHHRSV